MNRRTGLRLFGGALVAVLLLLAGLDWLFPVPAAPQYSPLVLAADGSVLHAYLNPTQKWRMKTELREITPVLRKAIIEKEDRWFYWHFGVNPLALVQAAGRNVFGTGRTTGASTITMQVARLLEPKERTFGNKLLEMARATQLEIHYSKAEILQLYLNLVPYGGNVEGVKSAALLYFQQPPDYLSLAQTVTLAIIPNRPRGLVLGKNNAAVLQERNRWLRRFQEAGLFARQDVADALLEPLEVQRHAAPTLAPHLSRRLVQQFPGRAIIQSSLQRNKQTKAEDLTRNYVRRLHELGITQAAVLVVNNRTRQVEAYVGSADFHDFGSQGQNDGVTAVRSPGSTLKPFLYALAMDRGLVTPKLVLPDVPTNFQGYRPENFDKHCNGEVTLERALAYSLNIPAVRVLNELGVANFTDKLRQAGFQSVSRNRGHLGLSSILGGCGASLEELTNLYVTLANGGHYGKLRLMRTSRRTSPPNPLSKREGELDLNSSSKKLKASAPSLLERGLGGEVLLVSPAAAFLTTDILAQLTRPDLPLGAASSMRLPKIAWKTGTSYGRRDAWSIGYNKQYTVGVWIGNFSGHGSPALTGADVATPLLFNIFNDLAYNSPNDWFVPPAALDFRLVCAETGLVPNETCPNQIIDYFLPGVSEGRRCQHQREVLLAEDGSFVYCRACAPAAGFRRALYPNLLPEVAAYKEAQGIPYQRLPPHNPQCQLVRGGRESAPTITSPTANTEYVLNRHEQQQLLLSCTTDNEVRQVYWYVNDKFLRAAAATERVFFKPPPGPLKISCADDHGRNTDVLVTVNEL
ncbi:penicillin-binding protein 1C [Hymenobacter sp. BT186]|uniref:peptidoglycan glycosyltransferase n=1 Tax=Hymenobacter telluris TaxID=2816474 RepID=A0A939EUL5_9BACT|nr:penicillin-binding protein 1C [Hymenobacter telluris]MBO0357512.1 penicillin-binding protein 1C [Hymenobacter telluris]MBW3373538.1 penicillin-binding protein 1C [Hymenobacter norwichensis]